MNSAAGLRVAVAAALIAASCSSSDSATTRTIDVNSPPLVLSDAPIDGGGEALIAEGRISIEENCVLVLSDRSVALIWKKDQTSWDADRQVILFQPFSEDVVLEFRDGDNVIVGGGGVGMEDELTDVPCDADDVGLVNVIRHQE